MEANYSQRRIKVRIGVFFDGTGNNRINSQIAAECRTQAPMNNYAHTKACNGRHADPTSSYANDLSNIARLFELYQRQPKARQAANGWEVSGPIYVCGIGTTSGKNDSIWPGQAFGRGSTGVLAKVAVGVKKLGTMLEAFILDNPGCVIERLEFDLFGFSRGAAAARHFANEVLKQANGALAPLLKQKGIAWAPEFGWEAASVQLKVIGLFETVAAVGGLRDFGNVADATNRWVNLYLPAGAAQQVLQLVAGDELRHNFALNSITPAWPKEIVLPGAHSDIGGGYPLHMRESLVLTRPLRSLVSKSTPCEQTPAWREAKAAMQMIDAGQWLDPLDMDASLRIASREDDPDENGHKVGFKAVSAAVVMDRRVYGHLSRIYLRVMHELVCAEGVPFGPVPDSPALRLVAELEVIAQKLIAYAKGGPYTLNEGEKRLLRRRYIHRSAHWSPRVGVGLWRNSPAFVHAPEPGGRVRYSNARQPGYPR